jgi:hypothetical protein
VWRLGEAARKQELIGPQAGCLNPGSDRLSGLPRQLEPGWLAGLALNDGRSGDDAASRPEEEEIQSGADVTVSTRKAVNRPVALE